QRARRRVLWRPRPPDSASMRQTLLDAPNESHEIGAVDVGPVAPGQLRDILTRLWASTGAKIGIVILIAFLLLVFLAPVLLPYNQAIDGNLSQRLQSPSAVHAMGTDGLGRDEVRRLVYGAQISLRVGLVAMLIGASIGTVLGLVTGFWGETRLIGVTIDDLIM